MMVLAYLQFVEARKERVAAGQALKQAQAALLEVETTSFELKNIKNVVLGHKKSIETILVAARKDKNEIAEVRNEAEKVKSKVDELNSITERAEESIAAIRVTAETSFLITKAKNDDRVAFDKILRLSRNEGPYKELLNNAITQIVFEINPLYDVRIDPKVPWKRYNTNPATAAISELESIYWSLPPIYKPSFLSEIWSQERFDTGTKLKFFYNVIKKEKSLRALHRACILMNKEAQINKNILGANEYLLWYETNKMKY
jgi:hypothetical protein